MGLKVTHIQTANSFLRLGKLYSGLWLRIRSAHFSGMVDMTDGECAVCVLIFICFMVIIL